MNRIFLNYDIFAHLLFATHGLLLVRLVRFNRWRHRPPDITDNAGLTLTLQWQTYRARLRWNCFQARHY